MLYIQQENYVSKIHDIIISWSFLKWLTAGLKWYLVTLFYNTGTATAAHTTLQLLILISVVVEMCEVLANCEEMCYLLHLHCFVES